MVLTPILAVLFLSFVRQDPLPTAEALLEIVDSAQAEFDDIAFVYEGGSKSLHPRPSRPGIPAPDSPDFQGVFAYRTTDNSCHEYKFLYFDDGSPPSIALASLLGEGMTRETIRTAGVSGNAPVQTTRGGILAWDRPKVPFRFFHRPMFRLKLSFSIPSEGWPVPDRHYSCMGWETIDDRRVLKVRLDLSRDPQPEPQDFSLYWIDLERGAHPVRFENYMNGRLRNRVDSIPLAQFPARGDREVWFPVAAREFSYLGENGISDEPQIEARYQVVAGTVRLDQGLSDRRFDLSQIPEELSGPLKKLRDNYRKEARESQSQAAVEKRIDKALEETQQLGHGVAVEAPSPSQVEERRVSVFSYAVMGLGVAALVVGFILWKRR